jgi:MYND finger
MPRFEIDNDPIHIAYGYDFPVPGVFLAVTDKRLKYNANASKSVNAVTEQIGVKDGGGSYFNLHTGVDGFGMKVDDQTMITFLRRYGIPEENIKGLPLKLYEYVCQMCKIAPNKCAKCKGINYCSQLCQKKDWKVHKIFCNMRECFQNLKDTSFVQGLFLPEKSTTPIIVSLPMKWVWDEDDDVNYQSVDTSEYLQDGGGFAHSSQYAFRDHLSSSFTLYFKDDFLRDHTSQLNSTIQYLCRMKRPGSHEFTHWRGNLVLVKNKNSDIDCMEYVDIELKDTPEVICFLVNLVLTYPHR